MNLPRAARAGAGLLFLLSSLPAAASRDSRTGSGIDWSATFETALEQASVEEKFVMVDFFTGWCGWCKVLDQKTYTDSSVVALSRRIVNVKVDAEARKEIAARYGVRSYPTILFLNPDGTVRHGLRGYLPPEKFAPVMGQVLETEAEKYALARQLEEAPADPVLRRNLASSLARAGDHAAAAAQIDTLLALPSLAADLRREAELDRWVYLLLAGQKGKPIREGLKKWLKSAKQHPRRLEGKLFQALAEDAEGRTKQARKLYEEIARESPGSWYAEEARERLGDG